MGFYFDSSYDSRPALGKLEKYSYGRKHVCPVCGKGFIIQFSVHKYWRYKRYVGRCVKYFCCYGCMVRFDKEKR